MGRELSGILITNLLTHLGRALDLVFVDALEDPEIHRALVRVLATAGRCIRSQTGFWSVVRDGEPHQDATVRVNGVLCDFICARDRIFSLEKKTKNPIAESSI